MNLHDLYLDSGVKMDKRPIELFGRYTDLPCPNDELPWTALRNETRENPYIQAICPYKQQNAHLYEHTERNINCDKIRKQNPNPLIGNCSVRMHKRLTMEKKDWIVCPFRFMQSGTIFKDCARS